MIRIPIALLLLASLCCFLPAQLKSEETEDLRLVYYDPSHAYLTEHIERCFVNALRFHTRLFDFQPSEKVTIFVEDFGDFGHGGAISFPTNMIKVGIEPFNYVFETMPANERMNWIMNHEMAHIAACDGAAGSDLFFRRLFRGKVAPAREEPVSMFYSFLANPRSYSPRWYHEGIAVFLETFMAGGMGRALGGYDEMVFRAMVRDGSRIYDMVGLESEGTSIDFQVGVNSYLYGTRFFTYLANKYGPEKLIEWVKRTEGTRRYFSSQFKHVYGVPVDQEWSQWIKAEEEWQKTNLALIRQYPVTSVEPICRQILGSVSRAYHDPSTDQLYLAVRPPGQMASLASLDLKTGRLRRLLDVKGAALYYVTSLALEPDSRKIFFTTDNNNWRDLNVLHLDSGRSERLVKDLRAGDLTFNQVDRSLWGIRHSNGLSSLVRLVPPYRFWASVYSFPYGQDVFDIDISPDGLSLSAAVADVSGMQKLVRFSIPALLEADASFEVLHDFEFSSPANFVFSPDGRYLYGSSYYTGASNIFRYDLERQEMEVLSNAETGLFRPLPLADGALIAFEYTAQGFRPARVASEPLQDVSAVKYLGQEVVRNHPIVKSWKIGSPAAAELKPASSLQDYSPLRNTTLVSAYPIVQGYKDSVAVGMRFNLSDRVWLSRMDLSLAVTPEPGVPAEERLHLGANYHYWNWTISGNYNLADFYDLFGPTKTSRKGYSLKLSHRKNLLFDTPRTLDLDWGVAGYGGLDRLPDYQNVAAPFERFLAFRGGLNYSFLQKSLGAVDDEKGVKWQVMSTANLVNAKLYPRIYGTLDYGLLTPLRNSPVWLRTSAGKSFGDRDEPFANFYFGGFGNNWVDHQEISRYREFHAFPGVRLNEIGGTSYAKGTVEWGLPPRRFKRLGTPYLYCNWARLSLFSTGLTTNFGDAAERNAHFNLGGQLDLRVVLFSYLNSTFSVGYAVAGDQDRRTSNEFMISLKLL
jgi:hypothetical protein